MSIRRRSTGLSSSIASIRRLWTIPREYRLFCTGQPSLVREITDEMLEKGVPDPEQLDILRSLGLRSYICAPLRARGSTLGAITFITAESGRLYSDADLALANELAYRIGVAVDNAQ